MPLPRPVWLLGWVSFFTDTASEMIYPLMPLFLTRVLCAGAMSLGVIDGRNVLDPEAVRAAGFTFEGIGRSPQREAPAAASAGRAS